jgi:dTDP-4-dehydrorhamnose 3,5-epimerase-like enzyme
MKVRWTELAVPGLFLSSGASVLDERGAFTKILAETDDPWPGPFTVEEIFWTRSVAGVMRGLHFQLPPFAARKLVYVVHGSVRDFVVDLRIGSPSERQVFEVELSSATGGLLIPAGCAHAYEALEDDTIVCYAQDRVFDDASYAGIRADSAGIVPRAEAPIVMPRDLEFPRLDDYVSPFVF